MRYPLKDGLNLYTIWAMMAHANKVSAAYPVSKDDWFLTHQVVSLLNWIDLHSKDLVVREIAIDKFTVEYVLDGLTYEANLCMADSDVTMYSWEYSRAAEFLRDRLAEEFKC